MIESYAYWIAATDRAYGDADARRVEGLRAAWRTHRLTNKVTGYDGAAFWIRDGVRYARVIRAVDESHESPVSVVDVDPALVRPGA